MHTGFIILSDKSDGIWDNGAMKPAVEAIRENPSWSKMSLAWMKVALWAFRYSEEAPTRNDIAKALIATQHGAARISRERRQ
jgi:hypothetical protein